MNRFESTTEDIKKSPKLKKIMRLHEVLKILKSYANK
jgi:hypothetical protein